MVPVELGHPSSRTSSSHSSIQSCSNTSSTSSSSTCTDGERVAAVSSIGGGGGGDTLQGTRGVSLSLHILSLHKVIVHSLVLPLRREEEIRVNGRHLSHSLGGWSCTPSCTEKRSNSLHSWLQWRAAVAERHLTDTELSYLQGLTGFYSLNKQITLRCVTKLDVTLRFAWILVPQALQLDSILPFSPSNTILK